MSPRPTMPDPQWKQQQAFIRATRRHSKKRSSPEEKLKLLDSALEAIPPAKKVPHVEAQTAAKANSE